MGSWTYLVDKLAWLYPEPDQARRLLRDAGLELGSVDLQGAAKERWFRVLEEAEKHDAIERVLGVARHEYSAHAATLLLRPVASPVRAPESPAFRRVDGDEAPRAPRRGEEPSARRRSAQTAAGGTRTVPPGVASAGDDIDFFVSYTARDKDWAVWIAWSLEQSGYRCVIQAWDFAPGSHFVLEMQRAVLAARQTLAVLSPDYFRSSYAAPEWTAALAEDPDGSRHRLVPVRVRECEPPGLLRPIEYIDLFRLAEDAATRSLLDGIAKSRGERRAGDKPAFPADREPARAAPVSERASRPLFPLRRAPSMRATVVGVHAELAEHVAKVVARLQRIPGVISAEARDAGDAASQAAFQDGEANPAGLMIVLVGGRTGKTRVIEALLDRQPAPVTLKLERPDLDALEDDEEALAITALRRRVRNAASFSSPDQAADLAAGAVESWIAQHTPAAPAGESFVLKDWEGEYLTRRLPQWRRGKTALLVDLAGQRELTLAALYVPLRATTDFVYAQDAEGSSVVFRTREQLGRGRHGEPPLPPSDRDEFAVEPARREEWGLRLEQALCLPELPYVVVEGDPGAGKSSLLHHLAYVLAREHRVGAAEPAEPAHALDLAALRADSPLLPVPILLEAPALASALQQRGGPAGLLDAVSGEIAAAVGRAVSGEEIAVALRAGRYLVLVDSLDEVPGEAARQAVVDALDAHAQARGADGRVSRIVLTTRPSTYRGQVELGARFRVLRAGSLGSDEVGALTDRFCSLFECDRAYRDRLRAALARIGERHGGVDLAENPLLLVATCLVYAKTERLPDSTAELYERLVDILLLTRKAPATCRDDLEIICEALQRAGGTERERERVANDLRAVRPERYADVPAADRALERIYRDTGLLRFERREDQQGRPRELVRPWHRSFQEYLAACRLGAGATSVQDVTDRLFEAQPGGRPAVVVDPAWEGVLRFLVGVQVRSGLERAQTHVERLLDHALGGNGVTAHPRTGRVLGLVAAAVADYEYVFDKLPIRDRVREQIEARFEAEGPSWPLADRLLALDAVGRLGDPRLDRDLWIEMPAGEFEMGGDAEAFQAAPRHRVRLDAFRISWRPITVQDFRRFVADAPDAEPPRWALQRQHPSRPVVDVSWDDARRFCRWASARWKLDVDLPTEAEWEYAARGTHADIYPWGGVEPGEGDGARANYAFDGAPNAPTPVGAFPAGHRGSLVDLAGNVWEWCLDAWRAADDASWRRNAGSNSPVHEGPPGSDRVVRGGSWFGDPGDLRAASRDWDHPSLRLRYLGFRVVCRRPREHVVT